MIGREFKLKHVALYYNDMEEIRYMKGERGSILEQADQLLDFVGTVYHVLFYKDNNVRMLGDEYFELIDPLTLLAECAE